MKTLKSILALAFIALAFTFTSCSQEEVAPLKVKSELKPPKDVPPPP